MKDAKGHGSNGRGVDAAAASELARGNPKAAVVPVHPGAAGPDRLSAYIGDQLPSGGHALTDWHGNQIGTANVKSSWATPRSYVGSRMFSYEAQHKGGTYTGRGFGKGMSINLKKRSR